MLIFFLQKPFFKRFLGDRLPRRSLNGLLIFFNPPRLHLPSAFSPTRGWSDKTIVIQNKAKMPFHPRARGTIPPDSGPGRAEDGEVD